MDKRRVESVSPEYVCENILNSCYADEVMVG